MSFFSAKNTKAIFKKEMQKMKRNIELCNQSGQLFRNRHEGRRYNTENGSFLSVPHFLAGLFLATKRKGMEHTLLESLQELNVKIHG